MAERCLGEQPPAARGTAVKPGHLGAGAGFIDEDEPVGIDKGPCRLPDASPRRDIRAVLLARPERLFLNDSPRRATADHIAPFDSRTPCSANSQLCRAASVRSGMSFDLRCQRRFLHRRELARPVTAARAGAHLASAPPSDQRLVDVRHADPEQRRRGARRHSAVNRRQNPRLQILRIALPLPPSHPWPHNLWPTAANHTSSRA